MMADFNQNFVTNNVTVESDEVIKFINPFENLQQHQIEDFSLFLSVSKKCRCCFSKLINESDQHTVESWQRQAYLALTGVEMMTPDSENFLCQKCAEILKIYTELGKSAANLQKKYNILIEDLASDIKTETDEISSRLQDYNLHSDIVKSDYEIISYDHEQLQQTNIIQNEIIRDKEISIEETIENSARVKNCTVRLTRIDSETIDKYEYYSIVGSREEQIIDQTSTTSAKLKRTIQKDRVANTHLKIMIKTPNNTKCHICGFSSKSLNGLKTHIRDHHIKPRLSCDFCVKSFFSKQNILQHMQTYHMNIKFSCHLCSAEFDSSAKLRDHKGIVHYKHLKCEECDAAFGKPCLLLGHIKAMHGGKRWYCHYQKCSSSFSLRFYAKQHFQKVHSLQSGETMKKYLKTVKNNKRKTKCQICGMTVKTQEALYEHFRKTHANTMRYSCDLCGKTFSHLQKMVLIDHMYKHQVKVKFSCSLCPAEFPSNYKLILHEKNSHNKKFQCEKCDSSFKEPKDLKEHVKVQHEGKRYKCQYPGCSKIYSLIGSLRKHLYGTHKLKGEEFRKYSPRLNQGVESKIEDDDDDAKCEICRKIFKSRSVLHGHIRLVHKKNKSCDICGKTFANKVLLINHMQTHHMKLQFECDLCTSELRSESKLKTHKRFAHYRNFKCEKCNLAFGNLYLLKNHVKVKHEGKRYHCSFPGCSASFTTRGVTAKHLVAAHSLMGENFNRFNEKLSLQ